MAILCEAYENASQKGLLPSDEAAAVEQLGKSIKTVLLGTSNIKLTYPEDLLCIEALLKHQHTHSIGD